MSNDINIGYKLGRSEMKKIAAGYVYPEKNTNCGGCEDCLYDGCDQSSGTYCGMIKDVRDGSYHRCYRS